MDRREDLQRQLRKAEQLLALSARAIRRQKLMIRWLEFDGHHDITETARLVRHRFLKTHATYVNRHRKLLIDLIHSNLTEEGRSPPR